MCVRECVFVWRACVESVLFCCFALRVVPACGRACVRACVRACLVLVFACLRMFACVFCQCVRCFLFVRVRACVRA